MRKLKFKDEEKPLIAQIWGNNPLHFYKAGKLIKEMGFDGIDVNFGCPVKDMIKHGSCGALVGNIEKVRELILALKEGAGTIPLSIKTRIGLKTIITESWVSDLLTLPIEALTIHGRTVAELSQVPAHWDEIAKAVKVRNSNHEASHILIIGNGDVKNRQDGIKKAQESGVDGIMIGRGIFHDIYAFSKLDSPHDLKFKKRLSILESHVDLYQKEWGYLKNYEILKKYFKIYINGFPGASEMRMRFMETKSYKEVYDLISSLKEPQS
jgi:tRNA-dihydrouridine synthase